MRRVALAAEPAAEGGGGCSSVFDEDYEHFGFAPNSTQATATYKNPAQTARQQAQNTLAGRVPLGQIAGVSADRAWKRSIGRPDVRVAILDTGSAAAAPASGARPSRAWGCVAGATGCSCSHGAASGSTPSPFAADGPLLPVDVLLGLLGLVGRLLAFLLGLLAGLIDLALDVVLAAGREAGEGEGGE